MKYRLALDMGSTSLGWAVLALNKNGEPHSLIDMGVRIYPDGRDDQSKEPLAVARRKARGLRRNLDRRDLRQKRLMDCLTHHGLMPQDEAARKELESLDPYDLRAKALDEKIELHRLGRALFHINQRRGFKSNRKTDRRENDSSNMKNAIRDLDQRILLSGSRTLGEYLWKQRGQAQPVRVRSRMVKNKAEYNFYPSRKMYADEVSAVLEKQKAFHPELTDEVCAQIRDIIFHQRPLKPPVVGKCRFEEGAPRIRKAHPLFQKFRILQDVNHLDLNRHMEGDPDLTREDKQKIAAALSQKKKMTFGQIRSLLELTRDCKFNMETEARSEMRGDDTAFLMGDEKRFGARWRTLSVDEQEAIVNLLFDEQDPDALVDRLMDEWDLDQARAEETANASLEDGYASLSRKAIEKILPGLEEGLTYDKAVAKVYPHHSDFRTGQVYERLPYYGEILPNAVIGGTNDPADRDRPEKYFGKINNPTVHIALNQVRRLVNALIDVYGSPKEIVVELTRDLKEPMGDLLKDQAKNKKDNDRINQELENLNVKPNYRNRMLFKLWEDLAKDPSKRCCPFTGIQIAMTDIFSGEFEEEHLLPFSRSFNDGRANKVLSHRRANREKNNRPPYDSFSHKPEWPEILARIQNLPANKQWRFKEECWDIAKGKGEDIIARMLNDTKYMSKIARQYLSAVFDNEKGKCKVYAIPGQMTALLRDKWGLNDLLGEEDGQKDRTDHRHHAIDAFVIGCTDRGTLQRLSAAARDVETKQDLWDKRRKLVVAMPEPFEGFRPQIEDKIENIVISYKPDHGGAYKAIRAARPYTVAPLHKQTAYGLVHAPMTGGGKAFAMRVPVDSLLSRGDVEAVADAHIRAELLKRVDGLKEKSLEWKQALDRAALRKEGGGIMENGLRRVRMHIEKTDGTMIGFVQPAARGKEGAEPYKYYELRGNYCAEIYCPDKGKKAGKWQCEVISNYHAHQKDFVPNWRKEHPTARLVMRLQINDMVAYEENGETVYRRVRKLNKPDKPVFVDPLRAKLDNNEGWAASPKLLQGKNARKIGVDILGRVCDPARAKKAEQAA
ncbi:MAG TPA: type II CRISPR RNA-guided endonuclease Cas9 [Alphaproteobacteria bacterium]|nr:type II CRISPR RNA-guided endonuclease Cas9 [Alphaproteobacteria bacterium]